jgi:hypothetical protein
MRVSHSCSNEKENKEFYENTSKYVTRSDSFN